MDKPKSYKIVGGKFVERTAEELVELERLKAEQAGRKLTPAKKAASAARMPRANGRFVMLTAWQAEKLLRHEHVCWPLFTILLFENFRQRGQPFILPTRQLNTVKGLRPTNLRQALMQLETCGLISITRNRPKPPLIAVL